MEKRGQVTLFIIIGIIIIAIIGLLFYFRSDFLKLDDEEIVSSEFIEVKGYVDDCLHETAKTGLFIIGKQGGYYEMPDKSLASFSLEFNPYDLEKIPVVFFIELSPYYFKNKRALIPSLDTIEKELSKYIKENIGYCINDFQVFEEYDFKTGNMAIKSKFSDKEVVIDLDYPILVQRDSLEFKEDSFSSSLDFDFVAKYEFVKDIVKEYEKNLGYVPLGFATNLGYENDFVFDAKSLDEGTLFVLLFEENLYDSNYVYTFILGE